MKKENRFQNTHLFWRLASSRQAFSKMGTADSDFKSAGSFTKSFASKRLL